MSEPVKRSLPVPLTPDELIYRGHELASNLKKIDELDSEMKASAKDYKSKIELLEIDCHGLSTQIRDKAEYRQVEVEAMRDDTNMEIYEVRLDSGEEIFRRPMNPDEKQMLLFHGKAGKA